MKKIQNKIDRVVINEFQKLCKRRINSIDLFFRFNFIKLNLQRFLKSYIYVRLLKNIILRYMYIVISLN